MKFEIRMKGVVPLFDTFRFDKPLDWTIREGENWAVVGPNGAGKTMLTDILQGRIARKEGTVEVVPDGNGSLYELVRSMEFRDIYSLVDCRNAYYQQRWNASDMADTPLAGDILASLPAARVTKYIGLFRVDELLQKRIISLSSGELRKLLIIKTLIEEPRVLILDNPFIGLDAASRISLNGMLEEMARLNGLQVILVLSDADEIPGFIDRVLPVKDKSCLEPVSLSAFRRDMQLQRFLFPEAFDEMAVLPDMPPFPADYDTVLEMESVRVRYGSHTILEGIDWKIANGEKWALLGGNGSGKSTLLSLVCGDNPQAYANYITLFDRPRGSGESIWDIKKRIGYLSPDLHTFYLKDIPCLQVVVSGFYDSIGLFDNSTEAQRTLAFAWMKTLRIEHLARRSFVKLSFGEQRLVLLARTFVKNPPVLILDEPMHGLDAGKKKRVRQVIEAFCRQPDKTLIYVTHYRQEIPECVTFTKMLGVMR